MQQREELEPPAHEAEARREGPRDDGIEQLREILFGAIVHDIERRIARTDAHHVARDQELQHEARRRVEIIEAHLEQEIEALTARMQREVAESSEAIRSLAREHRESNTALEQRVTRMEESLGSAQRQLRQQLLEQAKSFLDELQELRRDFVAALDARLGLVEGEVEGGARGDARREQ
jgi:hypothetical protein